VTRSSSEDILADFAHQLRQPLSTLELLAFYLDLIAKPEDAKVHEELRLIHAEIARMDQVLRDGLCTLRAHLRPGLLRAPGRSDSCGLMSEKPVS